MQLFAKHGQTSLLCQHYHAWTESFRCLCMLQQMLTAVVHCNVPFVNSLCMQGQSAPGSCCSWPQDHAALPAGHAEHAQLAVVIQKTADQALHSPQICSHGSQTGGADAHHQPVCPEGCVMRGNQEKSCPLLQHACKDSQEG